MSLEHWQDRFAAFARRRGAADPEWLRSLRAESMALFEAQGIPTTRMEAWRYTNLEELRRIDFETGGEHQDRESSAGGEIRQAAERGLLGSHRRASGLRGRPPGRGTLLSSEIAVQGLARPGPERARRPARAPGGTGRSEATRLCGAQHGLPRRRRRRSPGRRTVHLAANPPGLSGLAPGKPGPASPRVRRNGRR